MAVEIHELRDEDAPGAAALWQADGLTPAFEAVCGTPGGLVLVGRDGDKLVAVAACVRQPQQGYLVRLAVDTTGPDPTQAESLRRLISGVVMRKLRARGIGKCHITIDGEQQTNPFFASLRYNIPSDAA